MKKNNKKISLPKFDTMSPFNSTMPKRDSNGFVSDFGKIPQPTYGFNVTSNSAKSGFQIPRSTTVDTFNERTSAATYASYKRQDQFDAKNAKAGWAPMDFKNIDYAAIASGVGAAGSALSTSNNKKTSNIGKVMEAGGQFASIGGVAGTAIGGPGVGTAIGAGVGFLAGATVGLVDIEKDRKEELNTVANQDIAKNSLAMSNMSSLVNYNYNMNNTENSRIPMVDKGVSRFSSIGKQFVRPNAMVAKGEVTKDGRTGILKQVGGEYNKLNPDTVKAELTDGTSVYSKNPMFTLPGGKSTPADIMAKVMLYQKKADKVLSDTEKFAPIDRATAKINKINVNTVARQMNDYGDAIRGINQTNKFDLGGIASSLASLAPAFSNLNAIPDYVEAPIYNDYINVNKRYSVASDLEAIDKESNIALYNYRNANGPSVPLASELYAKKLELKSSVRNNADQMNYKYKQDASNLYNSSMKERNSQYEQYLDRIARTKAAAQNIRTQGITQLANFAQNSELMRQSKNSNMFEVAKFAEIAKDMPKDQVDRLMALMEEGINGKPLFKRKKK